MLKHLHTKPEWPQRVVVLGGSGFIGGQLVSHLRAARVPTLSLSSTDIDLTHSEASDRLRELLVRDDALVFVSAITPDRGRDVRTLMRNLLMAESVAGALSSHSCAHVVYLSSDAVYSDQENLISERSIPDPTSFHGLMHLVRERILAEAARRAQLPLSIVRPAAVYGVDDTHNSYGPNRFLRTMVEKSTIELFGQGEEKRDHVFVEDVAQVIALCLAQRAVGILNVATGKSLSFGDVAKVLTKFSATPINMIHAERKTPVSHRHFDITDFIKVFPGFRPTSLYEGIEKTIREFSRRQQRQHTAA